MPADRSSRFSPRTAAVVVGYALLAGVAISATRFGGGVACLWGATGLLVAHLTLVPRRRWHVSVLLCGLVNMVLTATVGLGPVAAAPLAALNMTEAVAAALMLRRFHAHRDMVTSLQRLAGLTFAAAVAAICSGLASAAVLHLLLGLDPARAWIDWATGHLLGTIAVTPLASIALNGEWRRQRNERSRAWWIEGTVLMLFAAVTTTAVFAQSRLPLLFVPVLPLILATLRLGRVGAAGTVLVIAVVGGWFTFKGTGPMALMDGGEGGQARFFQFYIAVTMMTALPLAAELATRRRLFDELSDSEARYRLLADHSSDIVMNLDRNGCIRYVSPSVAQLGGYDPAALIGTSATDLVAPPDRLMVTAAHRSALASPGETVIVEYRGLTAEHGDRWFETHTRAIIDEDGAVTGAVNVIRDIAHRKSIEAELTRAAATDPLTGLANRRAFQNELDRRVALAEDGSPAGCVAIFDLDHFKSVNDTYGHEVGDRVIEAFAQAARRSVREGDMVARLGGEEFGIVFAGATLDQAQLVCERLRATVARTRLAIGASAISVTVSAGIASVTGHRSPRDVMRAADAALYRAKRAGRNRLDLAA